MARVETMFFYGYGDTSKVAVMRAELCANKYINEKKLKRENILGYTTNTEETEVEQEEISYQAEIRISYWWD